MMTRYKYRSAVDCGWVRFCPRPAFLGAPKKLKGVQGKGLRYEQYVVSQLNKIKPWAGVPGPWIEFINTQGKLSYAQPDWIGFNFKTGILCIAEIKLSRVEKAWWQLTQLYKPLIEKLFPMWDIALLEIAANLKTLPTDHNIRVAYLLDDVHPSNISFMKVSYNGK